MSALASGLVHSGNQQEKVLDIDDTLPDEKRAARPLLSGLPKGENPANDLYHVFDKTDATQGETASAEATTLALVRHEGKKRIGCRLHHIEQKVQVGMVSEGNKTYGSDGLSEYEQERVDVLEAQMDSWEYVLSGRGAPQAGQGDPANGSGNHFKTRGGTKWLDASSVSWAADSDTNLSDAAYRTPDGSILTLHNAALNVDEVSNRFTKEQFEGLAGSLWDVQGSQRNFDVVCKRGLKERVNGFLQVDKIADGLTAVYRFNGEMEKRRLGAVVEIYATETGVFTFKMSKFLPNIVGNIAAGTPATEALILDHNHVSLAVRNKPGYYPVGETSLSKATAVAGTMGLGMRPRFHGIIRRNAAA